MSKRIHGGLGFGALATAALLTALAGVPAVLANDDPKPQVKEHEKVKELEHKTQKTRDQVQEHAKDKAKEMTKDEGAALKAGDKAPAFSLKDTEGKDVTLASLLQGDNVVVAAWFNPTCPFVKKHFEVNKTFQDLAAKYAGKNVRFVAINSTASGINGSGVELNAKMKGDWKINFPIVLDESGTVGRSYGAKCTPHCFVIAKDGTVAYNGAIDDNDDMKAAGKTNYVAAAVDALLAGKAVATATTRPYGCPVKYQK